MEHDKLGPNSRRFRRRLLALGIAAVLAAGGLLVFHNQLLNENFGVVDPGRVYRSAQPGANLSGILDRDPIASILNLRGGAPGDPDYDREVRETRTRGIAFYDFPMSANRRPTRRELLILIDLFARCRYPLLIHCKSGSDRTGLASGLYLMARRGDPPRRALGAFSLSFGHVPFGPTTRLEEPFREYDRWLQERGIAHSPARLQGWVEHAYSSSDDDLRFHPLRPGPRAQLADETTRRGLRDSRAESGVRADPIAPQSDDRTIPPRR